MQFFQVWPFHNQKGRRDTVLRSFSGFFCGGCACLYLNSKTTNLSQSKNTTNDQMHQEDEDAAEQQKILEKWDQRHFVVTMSHKQAATQQWGRQIMG